MTTHTTSIATPLTEMFNLRLPVIAGGLMWLSDANYVSAAARAGILGFITAASFPEEDDLRAEIRKCRELSEGNTFGVNVSMLPKLVPGEKTEDVFRLIIEEGVKVVETSGRNPEAYLPMLKEAGVKVIHKVPAVKYALKAQSIGVDAVSIVGAECGGHPGMDMIGSFVNSAMALEQLDIPFTIGGGVGHGAQIAAALTMGAAGAVIGTKFLVAEEIWAHEDYKQRLIAAKETDTALIMSSIKNTVRALANDTTAEVQTIERTEDNITIQRLLPLISGQIGKKAYETGDCSKGVLSAGHSLAFVHAIAPLNDIVTELETQALQAIERAASLHATLKMSKAS
ncbi:NAD(P)H-dependent flavin oxidoreductase [Terasakiella pusilla]|uniref:NAD(P)H-dependent flavin oxidoreductase n=1 Tax=Terasakiella pusilla TaxID=64973 RepID=UPI003AA90221